MRELVDINEYLNKLVTELKKKFGKRLIYVGLQGSYLRGEATPDSDIDVMLVLDDINTDDLEAYKQILIGLGEYDRACGFVCGRKELDNWFPQELCHVLHTTSDVYGNLQDIIPKFDRKEVADYVKMSVGNLYHMLCHRRIHSEREKNINKLPMAKRDVFFILQNLSYLESGYFIHNKVEVPTCIGGLDLKVWDRLSDKIDDDNFDATLDLMLKWCKDVLRRTTEI